MSDTIVARGLPTADADGVAFASDLEERAQVPAIEALHHERRQLIQEHGRLIALYGPFGLYDDRRKQVLETQKIVARQQLSGNQEKVTESRIESEAYGSKAYQDFLDHAYDDKVAFLTVQNRLTEIAELIQARELGIRAYTQEIRLNQ